MSTNQYSRVLGGLNVSSEVLLGASGDDTSLGAVDDGHQFISLAPGHAKLLEGLIEVHHEGIPMASRGGGGRYLSGTFRATVGGEPSRTTARGEPSFL